MAWLGGGDGGASAPGEDYALEANDLRRLICGMRKTAGDLGLSQECAPLGAMSALSFPRLRNLFLHGRYLRSVCRGLRDILRCLPSLRTLTVRMAQSREVFRTLILGHASTSTLSLDLLPLRLLAVAYRDFEYSLFALR
ncbi:hypothetical protein OH77DRAFT_188410 [Trametes cingulata]|nr:hypothetical protein OH77DRAFT_188410 [Trametes cingulata]